MYSIHFILFYMKTDYKNFSSALLWGWNEHSDEHPWDSMTLIPNRGDKRQNMKQMEKKRGAVHIWDSRAFRHIHSIHSNPFTSVISIQHLSLRQSSIASHLSGAAVHHRTSSHTAFMQTSGSRAPFRHNIRSSFSNRQFDLPAKNGNRWIEMLNAMLMEM